MLGWLTGPTRASRCSIAALAHAVQIAARSCTELRMQFSDIAHLLAPAILGDHPTVPAPESTASSSQATSSSKDRPALPSIHSAEGSGNRGLDVGTRVGISAFAVASNSRIGSPTTNRPDHVGIEPGLWKRQVRSTGMR